MCPDKARDLRPDKATDLHLDKARDLRPDKARDLRPDKATVDMSHITFRGGWTQIVWQIYTRDFCTKKALRILSSVYKHKFTSFSGLVK